MRKFFALLMALLPLQMMAADFIDDINSATAKYEAGHRVIYEMNVGSFTTAGTLAAAQQKLGDLKTLGVDIVWLMPIYPRGNSKSPYAVMDFDAVNSNYGTKDDLKKFVAAETSWSSWTGFRITRQTNTPGTPRIHNGITESTPIPMSVT